MEIKNKYIDELFSFSEDADTIINGSKKIFDDKLTELISNLEAEGMSNEEATKQGELELNKLQNHVLCLTIKTFADKYTKMVALYKKAKITIITIISVLFLCCLFLTTDNMTNKSVWMSLWVAVVIICAAIMLTIDYLRREYRKSVLKLLYDTKMSDEHLALLGISLDDGDEEIFEDEEDNEDENDISEGSEEADENETVTENKAEENTEDNKKTDGDVAE